ncbi:unnamed protein product, partial [Gadus morhua 'NCC']
MQNEKTQRTVWAKYFKCWQLHIPNPISTLGLPRCLGRISVQLCSDDADTSIVSAALNEAIESSVEVFEIEVDRSIGKLVLIELKKSSGILLPQDSWYPAKVELKSPEGKTFYFPIHRWITDDEVHQFREATACLVFDDTDPLAIHSRREELKLRKEQYCWNIYAAGLPQCMKIDNVHTLPDEVRFSFTKEVEFGFTALQGLIELKLDGLADCKEQWTSIDDIGKVFRHKQTALS